MIAPSAAGVVILLNQHACYGYETDLLFSLNWPNWSSHADVFWVVGVSVPPSEPPQGGFAVSEGV